MLSTKTHYLQVALNSTPTDARRIIASLPVSQRILIEAGTPLIKQFGQNGIFQIRSWWQQRIATLTQSQGIFPYVVADLKCMDRGEREVSIAAQGGAAAAVVLGLAPVETIDAFIENCESLGLDAMIDMMNVNKPYQILRKLKKLPRVVILHRGVDEEKFSDKPLPIHLINKIKGAFNVMISVAGGDTSREIQSSVFNGADIVVLWKNFYRPSADTAELAEEFLKQIK